MKNQLPQLKQNGFVLKNLTFAFLFAFLIYATQGWGQISIISLPYNPPVTNFNSYNPSSLANFTATIPIGWTGSSGTAVYNGQGTGTSATGGYWAYGTAGEFSLGALRSGTPGNITYSVSYVNNSGSTITAITLAWDYEQWRYANTSGWDCSGTGSLLGNVTLNGKDFAGVASGTSGTVSVTGVASFTLSGLSIANGATFGISWVTTDIASSDNGVAIDNFSLTAQTCQPLNVSISGNLSFCAGGSTTLDAGSGYSLYNWSVGATTQTINVNTATTVTVTVTDGNGCTGSDSKTTTVNANPTPSITGSTSFCSGSSTTLNAGSGYSLYNWSTGATTQTINVNTATTVTVTVTDGNGCSGSDSKTTTINANPTPSITGSTSFCAGGSTTLNAGSGYSLYNWSTGATTQTINVNTATTVTVTVTDGNGCSGSDSKTITINANLTPTITGSTSFCAGGSTTLNAGSGYSLYNWSTGGTTQTINVNTASTFTVTVTDANGCTGSASATTTVNPVPVVTVTGGGTFCGGSTTTLSATTGYSSYSWTIFGGLPITGTGPTLLVTKTGLYTVTVTNSFSCSSQTSAAVEIGDFIINGSLSAGSASMATRLFVGGIVSTCAAPKTCPGNSGAVGPFVYNLHTITNVNPNPVCATIALTASCGEFTFSTVYLGSFNPANNCTNYLADQGSAVTGGPWNYEVTIPGGATIVIKVNNFNSGLYCGNYRLIVDIPRVAAGITLSPPSPQCSGTPITLTASPANSYSWSPGAATTQAIVHNTGTTNYTVTLGYGNTGCTASASATAVINPLPTISTTGPLNLNNDPGVCSATVSNAQLMGQVTSVTGIPAPTVTFSPPAGSFSVGTTSVTATATNICGSSTSSFNVVVTDNQPPTATCQNIIVQLNPAGTATITPAQVNNGSTDNCGTVNLVSVVPNTFNCSNVNPVASSSIWINEIHYDNSGTDANEFIELAGNAGISLANYALVRYNGATPGAAVIYTTPAQITAMTGVIPNQSNGFGTFAVFFNVDGLQNGPNDGVALVNTATNTVVQLLSYEGAFTVAAGQGLASGMTSTNLPVSEGGSLAGGSIRLAGTGTQYSGFTWQAEAAPASPGSINTGQSFPAPAGNTVTLTINDGNGNTSTCNAVVTVNDVTPPTVVCQNINLPLDATGNATLTAAMVNNGSTDACGISTMSVSPNTFTCANIGGNTVTLTVTDINGNSATCTATVTVQDVTPPTANCQNLTVQLSAGGTASITAAQINNGSTDACGLSPTMTVTPNTFNCSDVTGDPVTDLFISEYIEGTSFNKAIEIYNGTGAAVNLLAGGYAIKIYSNGSLSASSTTNLTGTVAAGDVYVIANNTANAAILAQADQTSGNISFNGNDAVVLVKSSSVNVDIFGTIGQDPGTEWGSGLVSTADNTLVRKAAVTGGVTVNPPPGFPTLATQWDGFATDNSANLGSHTINGGNLVTLTVTDLHGNSSTCTSYVTVQDLIVPTISCPAPITVNNTTGQCGAIVNYTAPVGTDNCTVPTVQTAGLPPGSFFPIGVTTNTFLVTDNGGNTASCSFDVTVNDTELPTISCPAPITVNNTTGQCGAIVNYTAPVGTDNCVVGSIVTCCTGGVCTRVSAANCANAGGTVVAASDCIPNPCGNASITQGTVQTAGLPPGSFFPIGVTTNTFVVTDNSGNTASCSFDVTINDTEAPTISCPAPINVNNDPGVCGAVVNYTAPVGIDNCAIGSIVTCCVGGVCSRVDAANCASAGGTVKAVNKCNPNPCGNASITPGTVQTAGLPPGSLFPIGTTTNTFVVTDNSGNTASCSFNVTVTDNQDPTISCPPTVTVNSNPGVCYATNVILDPGGNLSYGDNCTGSTIANNAPAQYPVGGTYVQWEVTDLSGNKASCQQLVVVEDHENPVALCKNICIYLNSAGVATITGADIDNGSHDNCSIASLVPSKTTFSFADAGANTVTLTVTDINGNVSTCTSIVTVGEYYSLFGADNNCVPPAGSNTGCRVNIGNGNTINGNVGSYRLIETGGGVVINGNVYSGGKVNFANGVSSKSISAANLLGVPGNILSTGNSADITGNVDVVGNIYINQNGGSFVTGTVRHPSGTTYSGPVAGGGVLTAPPVLPALPGMPAINAYGCGGANITTTATLSPGSYGNITLGNAAGVIITFHGPGNYYFSRIDMGQGGIHTFKYDFMGLPGKINIYVCGDINFGTHMSQWANPNTPDACRVYFETHGTGSTNGTNSTMSCIIALGSQFYGRVWAPYGGINVGSGSCCTYATGSLWSAKQVKLEGAVTFNGCSSPCPPGPRIGDEISSTDNMRDMLQVYPNPTTGKTTVSFFAETPYSYTLKVIDYLGRVVLSNESKAIAGDNTMEIDMGGFAKGLYMIEVGNAEHSSQKAKVVVQ